MTFDHLHYQHEAPNLRRLNGIGTSLYGRFADREMAPVFYKQWVFTVFFVPVWFGRIYAVESLGVGRGWRLAGWISGREFASRYGNSAYWGFKAKLLALPIVLFVVAAIGMGFAYVADERDLRQNATAISSPQP